MQGKNSIVVIFTVGVVVNVGLRISSEVDLLSSIENSFKLEVKNWFGILINFINVVCIVDWVGIWFWIVVSRFMVKLSIIVVVLLDSLSSDEERGSEVVFHCCKILFLTVFTNSAI